MDFRKITNYQYYNIVAKEKNINSIRKLFPKQNQI